MEADVRVRLRCQERMFARQGVDPDSGIRDTQASMRNKAHRALPYVAVALCLAGCGGSRSAQEPPCDPETMRPTAGVEDGLLLAADASSPSDVWAVGESSPYKRSASALAMPGMVSDGRR